MVVCEITALRKLLQRSSRTVSLLSTMRTATLTYLPFGHSNAYAQPMVFGAQIFMSIVLPFDIRFRFILFLSHPPALVQSQNRVNSRTVPSILNTTTSIVRKCVG